MQKPFFTLDDSRTVLMPSIVPHANVQGTMTRNRLVVGVLDSYYYHTDTTRWVIGGSNDFYNAPQHTLFLYDDDDDPDFPLSGIPVYATALPNPGITWKWIHLILTGHENEEHELSYTYARTIESCSLSWSRETRGGLSLYVAWLPVPRNVINPAWREEEDVRLQWLTQHFAIPFCSGAAPDRGDMLWSEFLGVIVNTPLYRGFGASTKYYHTLSWSCAAGAGSTYNSHSGARTIGYGLYNQGNIVTDSGTPLTSPGAATAQQRQDNYGLALGGLADCTLVSSNETTRVFSNGNTTWTFTLSGETVPLNYEWGRNPFLTADVKACYFPSAHGQSVCDSSGSGVIQGALTSPTGPWPVSFSSTDVVVEDEELGDSGSTTTGGESIPAHTIGLGIFNVSESGGTDIGLAPVHAPSGADLAVDICRIDATSGESSVFSTTITQTETTTTHYYHWQNGPDETPDDHGEYYIIENPLFNSELPPTDFGLKMYAGIGDNPFWIINPDYVNPNPIHRVTESSRALYLHLPLLTGHASYRLRFSPVWWRGDLTYLQPILNVP